MYNRKRPEIQEYKKNYSASPDKIQPENAKRDASNTVTKNNL